MSPGICDNALNATYEFEGKRRNFFTPNSSNHVVSYELLVENARANGMASMHTNTAPGWLAAAHPMSIAESDAFAVASSKRTATERLALAVHIEAAIRGLLSARQALRNDSLNGAFKEAMRDIENALTDARAAIAYVYPPLEQEEQQFGNTVVDSNNPAHFEKIVVSLNTALNELNQATPGGKGQFLPDAIAETRQAIADVMARR